MKYALKILKLKKYINNKNINYNKKKSKKITY